MPRAERVTYPRRWRDCPRPAADSRSTPLAGSPPLTGSTPVAGSPPLTGSTPVAGLAKPARGPLPRSSCCHSQTTNNVDCGFSFTPLLLVHFCAQRQQMPQSGVSTTSIAARTAAPSANGIALLLISPKCAVTRPAVRTRRPHPRAA